MKYENYLQVAYDMVERHHPEWPEIDKIDVALAAARYSYEDGIEADGPEDTFCKFCMTDLWLIKEGIDTEICLNCGTRYYLIDD